MLSTALNKVTKLADDLYVIVETESVNQYLVVGRKSALLIDQGYGYEDITPIVRSITDLPVTAVATHGDPDHALGLCRWEDACIHELDYGKLLHNDTVEMRKTALAYRLGKMPELAEAIDVGRYLSCRMTHRPRLLREGDAFDLGGTVLRVLHIPGHSYGHIALWDEERKRLFTGDAVSWHNVWYQLSSDEQAPFSVALCSYRRMQQMAHRGAVTEIYSAHDVTPTDTQILDELVECFSGELARNYRNDQPFHTNLAVSCGLSWRHRYGHVDLVYSDARLEELLGHSPER